MSSMLWNSSHQPRRIFGWSDILSKWNSTYESCEFVQTVLTNLRMSTIGAVNYPLSHFLDFLNHEQEGIAWFLYETIDMRYKENMLRSDYVRELLDIVENLDGYFPHFPNSPDCTIRDFVNMHLTASERSYVQMMPPLLSFASHPSLSPRTPSHSVKVTKKVPSEITIRVMRDNTNTKKDDIIRIANKNDGTYSISYHDQESGVKTKTVSMEREDVLKYMSTTLRMMTLDTDPFVSIQFLMPNAPSVVIGINDLTSQTRDLIYDSVDGLMNHWPCHV